jgi:predicted nicotinamide N-methyase
LDPIVLNQVSAPPPPFPVVVSQVAVGGRQYVLRRPESADALLNLITEEDFQRDDRLPYWADIWPSSRILAERVAARRGAGCRLLELGCGVGLVALAAAAAGFSVLATDYYAEALEFASENARLNGLPGIGTRLVDWRNLPTDLGHFDLVVASDVLYERPNAALVVAAIAHFLAEDGTALITDPGRRPAAQFPDICREHGLEAAKVEEVPVIDAVSPLTVYVYEVRRAAGSIHA